MKEHLISRILHILSSFLLAQDLTYLILEYPQDIGSRSYSLWIYAIVSLLTGFAMLKNAKNSRDMDKCNWEKYSRLAQCKIILWLPFTPLFAIPYDLVFGDEGCKVKIRAVCIVLSFLLSAVIREFRSTNSNKKCNLESHKQALIEKERSKNT